MYKYHRQSYARAAIYKYKHFESSVLLLGLGWSILLIAILLLRLLINRLTRKILGILVLLLSDWLKKRVQELNEPYHCWLLRSWIMMSIGRLPRSLMGCLRLSIDHVWRIALVLK